MHLVVNTPLLTSTALIPALVQRAPLDLYNLMWSCTLSCERVRGLRENWGRCSFFLGFLHDRHIEYLYTTVALRKCQDNVSRFLVNHCKPSRVVLRVLNVRNWELAAWTSTIIIIMNTKWTLLRELRKTVSDYIATWGQHENKIKALIAFEKVLVSVLLYSTC